VIKRILFATDFSASAHHAERYASIFSQCFGASVEIIHVLEVYPGVYASVESHEQTEEHLAQAVGRLQQLAISAGARKRVGVASIEICAAAMDYNADLIVMGTRGKVGLEHMLLGSTAERVLTGAPCPVLTTRSANEDQNAPMSIARIIVPTDFSECSMEAISYSTHVAKALSASLTLLHVLEPVPYGDHLRLPTGNTEIEPEDSAASELRRLAATMEAAGVAVETVIRSGVPADSILEFVKTANADLIVMGTHGRRGIAHLMRGSVAEAVLRQAPCPVIAARRFPSRT
jgi:nucleotide-binding universal stress UspA family protein